jgi:hypothetical protein
MAKQGRSYVSLKGLGEFSKYAMTLGAAAFVYFEKFDQAYRWSKTSGIILAAIVVVSGLVIMSVLGRIKGEDIDYSTEKDEDRKSNFEVVSYTLYVQMAVLGITVIVAGYLALYKIWL